MRLPRVLIRRHAAMPPARPPLAGAGVLAAAAAAILLAAAAAPAAASPTASARADGAPVTGAPTAERLIKGLRWREIGPYRGGRSAAVTGVPGDRFTYYFGATGGGVWKSTDAGKSWRCVSDGFFGGSIGDVAVSTWDPNVVYAGTGEVTVRGNVSEGNGVWKSNDGGKSWKHAGLDDSRHVVRLRIHPKNPDLVYAAVLGHLFGSNSMRGVYRTRDGGASWQRVLHSGDDIGAVDLAMDPVNPRVLYAGMWRIRRSPWGFDSGGPGSGLWKSVDGGDTWSELSQNPGMPKAPLGIVGVSVSRTDAESVYAVVEASEGGVFRSRDGGKTWARTNSDAALRQRAWYYSRIYADPTDAESVYAVNVAFLHSKDGGKTFTRIATPHGDNHDLWIAPEDPLRMIEANDGGANVSEDGGKTWTPQSNQPTAQIYRVSTDTAYPYRIYGAQQDNSALRIAHRTWGPGIGRADWQPTAGGESGTIVADPANPDVVYGGSYGGLLLRVNHRTEELRDVNPWPDNPMGAGAADLKFRFQWNFPIFFGRDGKTLYAASNVLMKSADGGQSWQVISPDLTRNDKSKQGPAGGPITKDNTSVEYYDTIFTAADSPLDPRVLWAGSDDGLVHVSRDGGASWKNVTPHGASEWPAWIQINSLEASPFEQGGAYVAATLYKLDDQRPYLYKTTDYGATWTRIDQGIAPTHFTRVVRADPARRGLLFAGTEQGAYVSFDDGGHWQPLQANLPVVPVTDLTVKEGDLIAATQGRGFWSLDDLSPLEELAARPELVRAPLHLFVPRAAYRPPGGGGDGPPRRPAPATGENPPTGAVIVYHLAAAAGGRQVKIEILDADSKVIRTFKSKPAPGGTPPPAGEIAAAASQGAGPEAAEGSGSPPPAEAEVGGEAGEEKPSEAEEEQGIERRREPVVTGEAGLNRLAWDLTYEAARRFPGMVLWTGRPAGPPAAPGAYQVRVTVGDSTATARFELRNDPRSAASAEDLRAQLAFLLGIRDKLDQAHDALRRIREVRGQLDDLRKRLRAARASDETAERGSAQPAPRAAEETAAARPAGGSPPAAGDRGPYAKALAAARDLRGKLSAVEEALYQTRSHASEDPLNFPIRLNDKLNGVAASAALGDRRPSAQHLAVRDELVAAIDRELARLDEIWRRDLPAFNEVARGAGVGAVVVPAPATKVK